MAPARATGSTRDCTTVRALCYYPLSFFNRYLCRECTAGSEPPNRLGLAPPTGKQRKTPNEAPRTAGLRLANLLV